MDKQNFSPVYMNLSLIRAAAQKTVKREKSSQSMQKPVRNKSKLGKRERKLAARIRPSHVRKTQPSARINQSHARKNQLGASAQINQSNAKQKLGGTHQSVTRTEKATRCKCSYKPVER